MINFNIGDKVRFINDDKLYNSKLASNVGAGRAHEMYSFYKQNKNKTFKVHTIRKCFCCLYLCDKNNNVIPVFFYKTLFKRATNISINNEAFKL